LRPVKHIGDHALRRSLHVDTPEEVDVVAVEIDEEASVRLEHCNRFLFVVAHNVGAPAESEIDESSEETVKANENENWKKKNAYLALACL
jgi:hypothetical protein